MTIQKDWVLKGIFYECCRIEDGHCGLWFGRDLPDACINFATFLVKEGQIQNVNMEGIIIIHHQDGIGPKRSDIAKGIGEGAVYISDNATEAQRKVLEPFVKKNLGAEHWKKLLGVKFVKIDITEKNGTYHITMPFGEQKIALTIGGDGKTPVRMENPRLYGRSNVKFCNTEYWKYHDYGKNLEFHNTSGVIADFSFEGD
jgi:hypothetical protein